uniref:Ig-like domain-containing protein n=1 Tax=Spermophilus dauricus TaxID=99837 RepID=A0A8C9QDN4_SPEDA
MNLSGSLITKMTHISFFPLGRTHGQSMTQMEGQQTMSEGSILIINCTYSSSGYAHLFWYVQYPGDGPQLLLKAMKANDKGREKGFEATYKKETTSFHLEKASIQESDSAVYYCALSDTRANCLSVEGQVVGKPIERKEKPRTEKKTPGSSQRRKEEKQHHVQKQCNKRKQL